MVGDVLQTIFDDSFVTESETSIYRNCCCGLILWSVSNCLWQLFTTYITEKFHLTITAFALVEYVNDIIGDASLSLTWKCSFIYLSYSIKLPFQERQLINLFFSVTLICPIVTVAVILWSVSNCLWQLFTTYITENFHLFITTFALVEYVNDIIGNVSLTLSLTGKCLFIIFYQAAVSSKTSN